MIGLEQSRGGKTNRRSSHWRQIYTQNLHVWEMLSYPMVSHPRVRQHFCHRH